MAARPAPSHATGRPAPIHTEPSATLRGFLVAPPLRKPGIVLTDTSGRRFRLTTATAGKLTYLYFGYTHCPDVCPTTMADLAAALREQSPALRRRIAVVFVTVDPARDTGPVLAAWLRNFYPGFIGLTGTSAQIRAAENMARVPLAAPEPDRGTNYSVQHSAIVLAYSPDGRAHAIYTEGATQDALSHDMPLLANY